MALTVTMPQLGESVTEGTLAQWLKQPGEPVDRYEAIAEVVTDKVNAEIPSPSAGRMGEHMVEEGAVVAVGQPICTIESADGGNGTAQPEARVEEPAAAPSTQGAPGSQGAQGAIGTGAGAPPSQRAGAAAPGSAPPPEAAPPAPPRESAAPAPAAAAPAPPAPAPSTAGDGMHLTPAVRMLAREHGVDLSQISGSGVGGRITKKDVLEYVQRRESGGAPAPTTAAPAPSAATKPSAATPAPIEVLTEDRLVPLSGARRAIAEHMVRSRHTSPHAWVMVEVDMTRVARVRAAQRESFRARTGADLTFLPFVAQAVVAGLRRHPTLNASFGDDGIVLRHDANLGIATALEDNLIVPVIHQADRLSLSGLAVALRDLTDRARAGRLRIDELQGGTFTLNNAGALGTVLSQAIINQPQAAICVMDAIVKRPIVLEGDAIAVRSMMNLSLSFDHRINDGLGAARFLRTVKELLEGIDEAAIAL